MPPLQSGVLKKKRKKAQGRVGDKVMKTLRKYFDAQDTSKQHLDPVVAADAKKAATREHGAAATACVDAKCLSRIWLKIWCAASAIKLRTRAAAPQPKKGRPKKKKKPEQPERQTDADVAATLRLKDKQSTKKREEAAKSYVLANRGCLQLKMTEAEAINPPILPAEIQKYASAFVLADKLLDEALLANDTDAADAADKARWTLANRAVEQTWSIRLRGEHAPAARDHTPAITPAPTTRPALRRKHKATRTNDDGNVVDSSSDSDLLTVMNDSECDSESNDEHETASRGDKTPVESMDITQIWRSLRSVKKMVRHYANKTAKLALRLNELEREARAPLTHVSMGAVIVGAKHEVLHVVSNSVVLGGKLEHAKVPHLE